MLSRRSTVGFIVFTTVCFASLLLWARSYFYTDEIECRVALSTLYFGAESRQGSVSIGFVTFSNTPAQGLPPTGRLAFHNNRGWRYLTLRSMLNFDRVNRLYPTAANGSVAHVRFLTVPTWSVFALSAAASIWMYLRGRRKVHWGLRKDVSWINLRLRARIARFVIFSAIGCFLGAIVACADMEFDLGRTDGQWSLILLVLLPVVSLMAVYTRRRIPWHRAILWMSLELAGCITFFESTIDQIWRYENAHRYNDLELLQMILFIGIACFVVGAILLLFLQVKPEPAKPGPYCPECGYCLIGLPRQICSECGRPFTLDELGITSDVLIPPSARSA
jgi:hypothetical protein